MLFWGLWSGQLCLLYHYCPATTPHSVRDFWSIPEPAIYKAACNLLWLGGKFAARCQKCVLSKSKCLMPIWLYGSLRYHASSFSMISETRKDSVRRASWVRVRLKSKGLYSRATTPQLKTQHCRSFWTSSVFKDRNPTLLLSPIPTLMALDIWLLRVHLLGSQPYL